MDVKDLIIETALIGFVEKGFDKISLNELVQRTGLTKGAFYYYFKDKGELLREIYQRYLYKFIDDYMNAVNSTEGNAINKLDKMIETVLNMHMHVYSDYNTELDGRLFFRLLNDGFINDDQLHQMNIENNNRILQYTTSIITEGQHNKIFRENVDAEAVALLITIVVKGAMFEWSNNNINIEELLRQNIATIIDLYRV